MPSPRIVLPALLARQMCEARTMTRQNLVQTVCQRYEGLRDLLFLHGEAGEIAGAAETMISMLLAHQRLLEGADGRLDVPSSGSEAFADLESLAALLPQDFP